MGDFFFSFWRLLSFLVFLENLCPNVNVRENKLAHLDEREGENIWVKNTYLELRDLD